MILVAEGRCTSPDPFTPGTVVGPLGLKLSGVHGVGVSLILVFRPTPDPDLTTCVCICLVFWGCRVLTRRNVGMCSEALFSIPKS